MDCADLTLPESQASAFPGASRASSVATRTWYPGLHPVIVE